MRAKNGAAAHAGTRRALDAVGGALEVRWSGVSLSRNEHRRLVSTSRNVPTRDRPNNRGLTNSYTRAWHLEPSLILSLAPGFVAECGQQRLIGRNRRLSFGYSVGDLDVRGDEQVCMHCIRSFAKTWGLLR